MLTKEHLKFRIRNGRVKPELLVPAPPAALATAGDLLSVFRDAPGLSLGEVEETSAAAAAGPLAAALRKLLLDGCDVDAEEDGVEELRWQLFRQAQALRTADGPELDVATFQARLGAAAALPMERLQERLYGDLPACRRVRAFKDTTPEDLIHRYNLAQVQGLLLRARRVTLRIGAAGLGERRELFRQIRFRRLIAAVIDHQEKGKRKGEMTIELSGPLGLFDQASAYGLRLASFFPSVLNLPDWELRADVHIKNKDVELRVDSDSGLHSHYAQRTPYIPEELTAFLDTFNEREARAGSAWVAEPGADFVHIGRESYCFPDLTLRQGATGEGRRLHVELFHQWHASALAGRLRSLDSLASLDSLEAVESRESTDKNAVSGLYIGVSKRLAKSETIAKLLASSPWFAKSGFIFSDFPTPKALASLLSGAGGGRMDDQ